LSEIKQLYNTFGTLCVDILSNIQLEGVNVKGFYLLLYSISLITFSLSPYWAVWSYRNTMVLQHLVYRDYQVNYQYRASPFSSGLFLCIHQLSVKSVCRWLKSF